MDRAVEPVGWRGTLEADPLNLASHREWGSASRPTAGGAPGTELLRLLLVVALLVALAYGAGYGETVVLILVLIACIVGHELGHYVAAKTGGVKVTQFFVGFGPTLWSVRRGETEYGVKALPLGGYCRIVGMNNLEQVAPADEARTYRRASLGRRLLIDVAGSATHFGIAVVLLFAMFFWTGDPGYYLAPPTNVFKVAQIVALESGASPAEKAGFRLDDRILSIDGRRFASWSEMGDFIHAHAGDKLDVAVDRSGHTVQLYPVPVNLNDVKVVGGNAPQPASAGSRAAPFGFIGIGIATPVVHSGVGASVADAGRAFGHATAETVSTLVHRFSPSGLRSIFHMLSSKKVADAPGAVRLVSPVGVTRILQEAGQSGMPSVLWVLALINVFIGLFNLLPVFPLDGGRIVVALYEGIRSRHRQYRIDTAKLLPVMYAGLALILFFGASALFLDLRDLVT